MHLADLRTHKAALVDECQAWASQCRIDAVAAPVRSADKWIARSAFQKAVRRGQTQRGAEIALGLAALDSAYTWRAVETVAIEDVGFGSPECVTWAVASSSQQFRQRVGEDLLLQALVSAMCASVKTRSACELSWIVDTDWSELLQEAKTQATAELVLRIANSGPVERYAALMALRGMSTGRPRRGALNERGVRQACEVMQDQLPASHARAAISAFMKPVDTMSLACFPVFRIAHELGDVEIVRQELRPSPTLGGYASEAFDQHERRGRSAIRLFAADIAAEWPAPDWLPARALFGVVADAVFIEEGAALDKWVSGGKLSRLRLASDRLSMTRHGLSAADGLEVRRLVVKRLVYLDQYRASLAAEG